MSNSSDKLNNQIMNDNVLKTYKSFSGNDMVAMMHITLADGSNGVFTLGSIQTLTYSIHMERKPIRSLGNINIKDYVVGPRTIAGTLIFAVFNKHFAYEAIDSIYKNNNTPSNKAFLVDELPPFDVTVSFANEYGAKSKLVIYGIRLVNEGQVMSVNDIYTENTYQFFATDIDYLTDEISSYSSGESEIDTTISNKDITDTKQVTGKDVIDKIKTNPNKEEKIALIARQFRGANKDKKGIAYVTIYPPQQSGAINITGGNLTSSITIDAAQMKKETMPIYVSLDEGHYQAKYIDADKNKSTAAQSFIIEQIYTPTVSNIEGPIIESVSDTKISIYSNCIDHLYVKYAEVKEENPTYKYLLLEKRRAVITDLKAGTSYILWTCNGQEVSISKGVIATTLEYNDQMLLNLRSFIRSNQNKLYYSGMLSDYYAIIDECKTYMADKSQDYTVLDALTHIKYTANEELKAIKSSDYDVYEDYRKAVERLNKRNIMALDLIYIAIKVINDNTYALNNKSIVKPPAPEVVDYINNVFLVTEDINRLEFYRQFENTAQFTMSVHNMNFRDYSPKKKYYTFYGKPGLKHYVYAYDNKNNKSARVDFYVMTDEERQAALLKIIDDEDAKNQQLIIAESAIGNALTTLNLQAIDYKRALVQYGKQPTKKIFEAPVITESTIDHIVLDVDYKTVTEQFDTQYYIVIANVEDAFYNQNFYKIDINKYTTSVEFTALSHGLKPDNAYAIWIEDSSYNQISECVTVSLYQNPTEDIIENTNKVELYFNNKLIDNILKTLANKIPITDVMKDIINNLRDDITVNSKNVYDRLIQNALEYKPRLSNISQFIESVLETKFDIDYHIDRAFLSSAIFDKPTLTVTFAPKAEDYMITVLYINDDGTISYETSKAKAGVDNHPIELNTLKGIYATAFAVRSDIYNKSGIVFVNLLTKNADKYAF